MEPTQELDDIGWALLRELQANARLSFSELGRRVGLTPPAAGFASATTQGPTYLPSATLATSAPASSKWNGASTCAPVCTLIVTEPKFTLDPSRIRLKVWHRSGDIL